jgi:hypothetical protein
MQALMQLSIELEPSSIKKLSMTNVCLLNNKILSKCKCKPAKGKVRLVDCFQSFTITSRKQMLLKTSRNNVRIIFRVASMIASA